ncbi:mitochondrial inner membrane protease ATP23 [Hibiscus syriacus]|uniref:Mitochondrial inner membrane protease ATP23 n=1 Tax=Hibiscus syriacus TaxID=106335 RepID=A0A6A2ZZ22_HIBSY|nr:zinc finger protein CONSTANS-LIKE 7-like [Hibiscus syriacus]KAE8697128.1 mitochondrial inner membrane protease ATP23 [Hibiscus syriacus]
MCNKNNSTRRSNRKPKARSFSLEHSRKTRSKTRRPKYLSLHRLEENLPQMSVAAGNNEEDENNKEVTDKQLNLFPLHPENLVEDRDAQYDNVSMLFNSTEEDGGHAVTLNGLLDSEGSENYKNQTATTTVTSDESPLSPSLTYGCYGCDDRTKLSLVRTAMKGKKERDESEERWVVYSEVVEKKEMEEVSSGGDGGCDDGAWWSRRKTKKLLALKLDYEEIMNAWSDKGTLYIEGESPQTVPHLHANILYGGSGSASNVWKVPEMTSGLKIKEEEDGKEDWKKGHREASVLRYKEKRQNRLFAKRIRYEVRKLNAEKRPRLKGRFVKRD